MWAERWVVLLLLPRPDLACLESLQVKELPQFVSRADATLRLDWAGCGRVEVRVRHQRYLACSDGQRDREETRQAAEAPPLLLTSLQPHSVYLLEVVTGNSSRAVEKVTRPGLPAVRPVSSPVISHHSDSHTQLTFNWRPPPQSRCPQYNCQLGGYHYRLVARAGGRNTRLGRLSLHTTSLTAARLAPNSTFSLYLHVTDMAGQYRQNIHYRLERTTTIKPSRERVQDAEGGLAARQQGSGVVIVIVALASLLGLFLLTVLTFCLSRLVRQNKRRKDFRQSISRYLDTHQSSVSSRQSSISPQSSLSSSRSSHCSGRTRSPADPLPAPPAPLPSDHDVPGYLAADFDRPERLSQEYSSPYIPCYSYAQQLPR